MAFFVVFTGSRFIGLQMGDQRERSETGSGKGAAGEITEWLSQCEEGRERSSGEGAVMKEQRDGSAGEDQRE